ncbi:MAG: hypothetical protein AAGL89_16520 [Pseudomonadota bacterium]
MRTLLISLVTFFGLASAAAACPDWRFNPTYGAYSLSQGQLNQGQSLTLVAGGSIDWANCPHIRVGSDDGPGWFEQAPDVRFFVNGVEGRNLTIRITSACDSALLINTGTASWYYDDDDAGNLDAQIVLTRPVSGQIDVWAGTYNGEYCDARVSIFRG